MKVPTITDVVRELTPGTRYVLCVLKPTREFNLDQADLRSATYTLSQGQLEGLPAGDYVVVAGVVGQRPVYVNGEGVPFRRSMNLRVYLSKFGWSLGWPPTPFDGWALVMSSQGATMRSSWSAVSAS